MRAIYFLFAGFFLTQSVPLFAQQKLKDFRGTAQNFALLGLATEFVDPSIEESIVQQLRRKFNKYTKSYGDSSIQAFNLGPNPGKQFYKPAKETMPEAQKKYLQETCKQNSIDIVGLGSLRPVGDDFEVELQLFDNRIDQLSKIESTVFKIHEIAALDNLVFRVMNYLDREGYVYNSPQDFLEPPLSAQEIGGVGIPSRSLQEEFALNPSDVASGVLVGGASIGGDKKPFWEKWWFWTVLGGSLITAGSLSYYFLVVDSPPTKANVNFTLP